MEAVVEREDVRREVRPERVGGAPAEVLGHVHLRDRGDLGQERDGEEDRGESDELVERLALGGAVDERLRQERVEQLQADAADEAGGEQHEARPVRSQVRRDEVADGLVGHGGAPVISTDGGGRAVQAAPGTLVGAVCYRTGVVEAAGAWTERVVMSRPPGRLVRRGCTTPSAGASCAETTRSCRARARSWRTTPSLLGLPPARPDLDRPAARLGAPSADHCSASSRSAARIAHRPVEEEIFRILRAASCPRGDGRARRGGACAHGWRRA